LNYIEVWSVVIFSAHYNATSALFQRGPEPLRAY